MKVLRQVPESEEVVKVNRTVSTSRSTGPFRRKWKCQTWSASVSAAQKWNSATSDLNGDTSYRSDFARNSVFEQRYRGQIITPGTKLDGQFDLFVLGTGVGTEKFIVPVLVGKPTAKPRPLIESRGWSWELRFSAQASPDTCAAYIWKQRPEKYDADNKFQYIRPVRPLTFTGRKTHR